MTFRWTDRAGVVHELTDHQAIEQERQQVRAELLALRDSITRSDDDAFLAIHEGMERLRSRFFVLQEDLARFVRHEAERAIAVITKIDLQASFIGQLHRCYDQHAQRRDDNTAMCASPSPEQIDVLKQQAIHDGKPTAILATFGEAHAVLLANPATCRTPLPSSAPALEWTDRDRHYHQVRDLRQIEREYVAVARELALLLPRLAADVPIRDNVAALQLAHVGVNRVTVLERSMNRWSAHVIGVVRGEDVTFLDELEKSDGRHI